VSEFDPTAFVSTGSGSKDFGFLETEDAQLINRPAGPIRLQHGYPGPKGYGRLHVEGNDNRMKQLAGLKFSTFSGFAEATCSCYTHIYAGDGDRLIFVREVSGRNWCIVAQYNEQHKCWSISTGIVRRVERTELLLQKERGGGSEPAPGDTSHRPRFETLTLSNRPRADADDSGS